MINEIETYRALGAAVAVARNNKDEALAKFQGDYYRRCLALEAAEDKPAARAAYTAGYEGERHVPTFKPF